MRPAETQIAERGDRQIIGRIDGSERGGGVFGDVRCGGLNGSTVEPLVACVAVPSVAFQEFRCAQRTRPQHDDVSSGAPPLAVKHRARSSVDTTTPPHHHTTPPHHHTSRSVIGRPLSVVRLTRFTHQAHSPSSLVSVCEGLPCSVSNPNPNPNPSVRRRTLLFGSEDYRFLLMLTHAKPCRYRSMTARYTSHPSC